MRSRRNKVLRGSPPCIQVSKEAAERVTLIRATSMPGGDLKQGEKRFQF
ncbi:MAG: hypothetical protein K0Q83_299 [Deltaproteobacteria bacterium]|jgi:hypothetical protein|nr:hypothetical protein [Deltaproteobacteria bacterium]